MSTVEVDLRPFGLKDKLRTLARNVADLGYMKEALDAALATTKDPRERDDILKELARPFAQIAPAELYPLWRHALHVLATRQREELVSSLAAFTPVLVALGGPRAVKWLADTILEVGRWWP